MPAKKSVTVEEAQELVKDTAKKAARAAVKKSKVVAKKVEEAVAETAVEAKVAAKKAAAKRTAKVVPVSVIQYQGKEADLNEIYDKVKSAFVAEGHKASEIKSVKTYVKPEDGAVYFVINEEFNGKVDLF